MVLHYYLAAMASTQEQWEAACRRADVEAMERLLSIEGEDRVDVHRKFYIGMMGPPSSKGQRAALRLLLRLRGDRLLKVSTWPALSNILALRIPLIAEQVMRPLYEPVLCCELESNGWEGALRRIVKEGVPLPELVGCILARPRFFPFIRRFSEIPGFSWEDFVSYPWSERRRKRHVVLPVRAPARTVAGGHATASSVRP